MEGVGFPSLVERRSASGREFGACWAPAKGTAGQKHIGRSLPRSQPGNSGVTKAFLGCAKNDMIDFGRRESCHLCRGVE